MYSEMKVLKAIYADCPIGFAHIRCLLPQMHTCNQSSLFFCYLFVRPYALVKHNITHYPYMISFM